MKSAQRSITLYGIFAALAILLIPFHTLNVGGHGIMLYICIPLLFMAFVRTLSNRERFSVTALQLSMVLFLLYYFFAALWAPELSSGSMYTYLKAALFAVCIAFGQYTDRDKTLLMIASFLAGVIVCVLLLTSPTVIDEFSMRVSISVFGTNCDPNYMSFSLLIPVLICLRSIVSKRPLILKAVFIAVILAVLYGIISTGSRGGAIAITVAILTYFLYWGRLGRGRKIVLFLAILVLAYAAQRIMELMPEGILIRFTYAKIARSGAGGRLHLWTESIRYILQSPLSFLFGYGSGSSGWLLGIATHNHLLQIWLENGFIGVLLYLAFLYQLFRYVLRRRNGFTFAALVGAFVLSLSVSVQTMMEYWAVISVCIALGEYQPFLPKEETDTALSEEDAQTEETE